MIPSNLTFWSISRKESLESQQKHAPRNKFLRTLLCSNDIFIPGYNRKMLMRKRTSIFARVCFNYEQLFHPVVEDVNVAQEIKSLQVIPNFYTNYSKNSHLIPANTYEKYIVSKEYCIARHEDKMCFLANCRYHVNLIGNIKELLQKLDAFCFNYQHVDCLYTLFKYASVAKLLSRVDNSLIKCRGQFFSTT